MVFRLSRFAPPLGGICAAWLLCVPVLAQEWEIDWEQVDAAVQSANRWASENIDDAVLARLGELDREKIRNLLASLQRDFQSRYVLDLAVLKTSAEVALPLLEQYEETYPYAIWLKTRLDYLQVADQLRRELLPPGKRPSEVPNPSAKRQQQIWIEKVTGRPVPVAAKTQVDNLKPVFQRERIPPALVWIAEVESSFDPRARSPAGAVGLYQLMPATAQRFGLTLKPEDQRLIPNLSARAAARYLRFLYGKFADWRLALAAYNAGEGTVQRALGSRRAKTFEDIAASLPAETQLYVPKIEATLLRREGLKLGDL